MKDDLITVIIPVYKVEKYINKCIKSVLNQTYKNLEIIIVDDGSPDNCGKICDEYGKKDNRIRVIHQENAGLSEARNAGLKIAKGEYIYLVDSDDFIDEPAIEYLYELAIDNNADIAIGNRTIFYEGQDLKTKNQEKEKLLIYNNEQALEAMLYNTEFTNNACNKLYKTSLFNNIKYPKGRLCEDLGTTYKLLLKANKIVLGNKSYYNYLADRNDSIMNVNFNIHRMDGLDFAEEILKEVQQKHKDIQNAAIVRLYLECIFILLKIPNTKKYRNENIRIKKYLRKYRWDVLRDKKLSKKQKGLCFISLFGRNILRMVWNIKENVKKGKNDEK